MSDDFPHDPIRHNAIQQYLERVTSIIAERGWVVQGVFPTEEHPGPEFAYTVGLWLLKHPELIIFGLSGETAQTILNVMGDRIKDEGMVYEAGRRYDDVIVGSEYNQKFEVELRAVPTIAHQAFMNTANAILGGSDCYEALQVVWPDPQGLFPWEPGYDKAYGEDQPVLNPEWSQN